MSDIQTYRRDPRFIELEGKLVGLARQMDEFWAELNEKFPLDDSCGYFIAGNGRLSFGFLRSPDEQ